MHFGSKVITREDLSITLAYSIFKVQHPAYMSAPLSAALAFWAQRTDSNVYRVKDFLKKMLKVKIPPPQNRDNLRCFRITYTYFARNEASKKVDLFSTQEKLWLSTFSTSA